MAACSAYSCTNRPSKKIPGITFHSFPKNEKRRAAWIKAVRRKNWMPSKCAKLCSEHFTEDQFDRTSLCYVRLKENAVPNVFKGFPSYLQMVPKQRKPPKDRDKLGKVVHKKRDNELKSNEEEEERSKQPSAELEIHQHIVNSLEKEESKPTIAELEVGLYRSFNVNSSENEEESKPTSEELEEEWEESKPSVAELDAYQSCDVNSLETECEDRKPSIAELEAVAERHLACQVYVQENMPPPPDDASEFIVPESEYPVSSDEPYCQYVQAKLEPLCSPGESSTIWNQLKCDSFNANGTCPDDDFNYLENGFQLCMNEEEENNRVENNSILISGVENDHLYSNISPKLLKERIDLVWNDLILAKRKLKTDRQRNRRAREIISRLIGTVINLQRKSLLH